MCQFSNLVFFMVSYEAFLIRSIFYFILKNFTFNFLWLIRITFQISVIYLVTPYFTSRYFVFAIENLLLLYLDHLIWSRKQ